MMRLIRRAAQAGPRELWYRSNERLRSARDAVRVATGVERWDRAALAPRLAGVPAMRAVRRALEAQDWAGADARLRDHLRSRARFVLGPGDRAKVTNAVLRIAPHAAADAARRAARLVQHRYDLLGYRDLDFSTGTEAIDWHRDPVHDRRAPMVFWRRVAYLDPAIGDHKIIWELNRHQHWLALGRAAWLTDDPACAAAFERELESWLRANPPLVGINWASMLELAFRSLSWLWALHLFAGETTTRTPWSVDLLLGLARQLDHVARHLSTYFSPNTHLLGEALALYVAGRALPELAASTQWEAIGRTTLMHESTAQVLPDGAHAELSAHYHRYALDFYLLALVVARRTDDPAAGCFMETVSRLAGFCRAIADDRGRLPLIGDDDGGMLFPMCGRAPSDAGDSLALAAALLGRPDLSPGSLPEETIWMLAGEPPGEEAAASPPPPSRLFRESGYAALRTRGAHAVFDAGPHGFLNGGHAHADALSVVLSIAGRPLLIDPGTSTYTMDAARRDRFRSTAMHNTVTIDGREQSVPDGPFHWQSRASARIELWRSRPEFDCVEGSHDGYAPLAHRRCILRIGDHIWVVADHVIGSGRHEATAWWHFAPEWLPDSPDAPPNGVTHRDGTRAALASTGATRDVLHGDAGGFGWWAPVYGREEPALTVRSSLAAAAPFSLLTAIAGGAASAGLDLGVLPVWDAAPDGWHRAAAGLAWRGASAIVLFAAPGSDTTPRQSVRVPWRAGDLVTDARVAFLQLSEVGEPVRLVSIEATRVSWTGPDAFELAAPEEQDLHCDRRALRRLGRGAAARPAG